MSTTVTMSGAMAWFAAAVSPAADDGGGTATRPARDPVDPVDPGDVGDPDDPGETAATSSGASLLPFTAIVEEYGPAVYRLARSVVRDSALADDVAQETFIQVWRHLDQFRGDGALRGWVLRIAHNQAVSTLRRIRDTATDPTRLPDGFDPIPVNRVVEGRVAASELLTALDELDDLSREIVVLREVEALSYEDIATTLDVPIPTVKTRLLRARRALASRLGHWREET